MLVDSSLSEQPTSGKEITQAPIAPDKVLAAPPAHVRFVKPADVTELCQFLEAAHNDNAIFKISKTKVLDVVRDACYPMIEAKYWEHPVVVVIDGDDGKIAASLGMMFEQFWYTDEWSLCERWCFVREEYRRSTYAKDLLNWGMWFSDRLKLPFLTGVMSTHRTEAKVKLYGRLMRHIGGFFMHNMGLAGGPLAKELTDG